MKLDELLAQCKLLPNGGVTPLDIRHVCCDSRTARDDSVFVCIIGSVTDGHLYARSAYEHGCRAFIAEYDPELPEDAVIIYTRNTRGILAELAAVLYRHPSDELKVIGITGTKGKTTTALMICGILNNCGIPTGYIGSNGVMYGSFKHQTANTTPESCDIQRYLRDMADNGIKYAVIEVSSQALYLGRVHCVSFDTCVFTNLSHDHIGGTEHPDFEHYKACKASLFTAYPIKRAVVNADDEATGYMLRGCPVPPEEFGLRSDAQNSATDISMYKKRNRLGMSFSYVRDGNKYPLTISLPGEFNILNALAAITVCYGIIDNIQEIISSISGITAEGRFELVPALPYATIIIDYAHNGISLRSVLETLRKYCGTGRIICLFGSVGSRTQLRRAELGAVASRLSDLCILTSDNPDSEDPDLIIRDIAAAFEPDGCQYISIPDRRKAIITAMGMLRSGDILLLAGKGHENYQLVRGRRHPFCERDIVREAAAEMLKLHI